MSSTRALKSYLIENYEVSDSKFKLNFIYEYASQQIFLNVKSYYNGGCILLPLEIKWILMRDFFFFLNVRVLINGQNYSIYALIVDSRYFIKLDKMCVN